MFERLRQTVRDAMSRASSPEDRRAVVTLMREALVEARVGLSNIRAAAQATQAKLSAERAELDTVQRRGRMAAEISDQETVAVAAQYGRRHSERIAVLEKKLAAQQAELALADREVEEMTAQLKAVTLGTAAGASFTSQSSSAPDAETDRRAEGDQLRHAMDRASREAQANRQLEELKRRMGK
jgi:hypothetical protein